MRSLDIYFHGIKAGQLTENIPGKLYSFKYLGSYLQQPCGAISVTLPLTDKVYESDKLFPFFANMLPEGANKRIVCIAALIFQMNSLSLFLHHSVILFVFSAFYQNIERKFYSMPVLFYRW